MKIDNNYNQFIGDLPKTNGINKLYLDTPIWYEHQPGPNDFREAPERLAYDENELLRGWQPDKRVSFNVYLLSPLAPCTALDTPDVSATSAPWTKHWIVPSEQFLVEQAHKIEYLRDIFENGEDYGFEIMENISARLRDNGS